MDDGAEFARSHGLGHLEDLFRKGALAAQDPLAFDTIPHFTEAEKDIFRREMTHRWDHPGTLYYLVILCSVAAAVQGVSGVVVIRLPFSAISSYLIRWTRPSSTARICSLLRNSASTPTRATRARTSGSSASSTRHHMYALRSPLECVPIHCSLVALLCHPWLLAHRTSQSLARPSGHHLRLRLLFFPHLHLARCHEFMAASLHRSLFPRNRHRSQVFHGTSLCR